MFRIRGRGRLCRSGIDFFARVTRRIHAPLALVGNPLRTVRRVSVGSRGLGGGLGMVKRGAGELLSLANRLLSFRGVKTDGFRLGFRAISMATLLGRAVAHFRPAVLRGRGRLLRRVPRREVVTTVSGRTVAGMLDGLLGGTLGCTHRAVVVSLFRSKTSFAIHIIDSKRGVPRTSDRRVFRPFCRMRGGGSAIQVKMNVKLPLTHSLTALRGNELCLSVRRPRGAFILAVPLGGRRMERRVRGIIRRGVRMLSRRASARASRVGNCALLLMRSGRDVESFVFRQLRTLFAMRATIGKRRTLSVLHDGRVSLIVDSVVVPIVGNCRLYGRVGTSVSLYRVPIVFLATGGSLRDGVGKLGVKTRTCIRGPFSFGCLGARVLSLLDGQEGRHRTFSGHPFFPIRGVRVGGTSRRFVGGIVGIVRRGVSSRGFGIRHVTSVLYVDHSDLLEGVGVLFGLSPVSFVQLVHLGGTTRLVRRNGCHVKSVYCVMKVGSSSCFDGLFLGRFKVAPGRFRGRCRASGRGIGVSLAKVSS